MIKMKGSLNRKKRYIIAIAFAFFVMIIAVSLSGCSTMDVKSLDLNCNYIIDAQLDPYNETLKYTEQAQIRNDGEDSTKELYFHLYGNMYKTDDAKIEAASITDDSGNPVRFKMEDDDQLIHLSLNDALDSGSEITLTFTCEVIIPVMESVYGISRDGEIQMSFFYPQLAVYDEYGWNTEPLFSAGDGRYAKMADYYITIQAPSGYDCFLIGKLQIQGFTEPARLKNLI